MPFLRRSPLNYPANVEGPIRIYEDNRAPTNADFRQFVVGDEWWDTALFNFWKLVYKDTTQGIWRMMSAAVGALTNLTPDVGGQVTPDAFNNINLLGDGVSILTTGNPGLNTITISLIGGGAPIDTVTTDDTNIVPATGAGNINYLGDTGIYNNGIYFFGDVANNTVSARDLRNITIYVVDPTLLETEYQTIQAALDQAFADLGVGGSATIYVRPGIYVENLTFYNMNIDLVGSVATPAAGTTQVIGAHTPGNAFALSMRNLALADAANILTSAAASATTIAFIDCTFNITNGTAINLPNWTGIIATMNCHSIGTLDSYVNIGAGAAPFIALGCTIGIGAGLAVLGGIVRINDCNVVTGLTMIGQAIGFIRSSQTQNPMIITDDAYFYCTDTNFFSKDQTFINIDSSVAATLSNVTIDTLINPGFAITGTGTVVMHNVGFINVSAIDPGIIQQANEYEVTGPMEIIPNDSTDVAEDAWIKFNIPGVMGYSFGIDNSTAADDLKLTDGIDPSNGNEIIKVDGGTYAITFNAAYTFPTTDGLANQVLQTDGAGTVTWASGVTNQVVIQTFTANGNYVPTVGMQYCIIEVLGGGGGGGGSGATAATTLSAGGGGGSGEYARGVFSAAAIGVLQAVSIGVGGAGNLGAGGGNGGNSSVGALISANGGNGAALSPVSVAVNSPGGLGGTGGAGGSFRTPGQSGLAGIGFTVPGPTGFTCTGAGGNSQYGAGGQALGVVTGANGLGYGAGGSGGGGAYGTPARAGGNGSNGIVIITEYI